MPVLVLLQVTSIDPIWASTRLALSPDVLSSRREPLEGNSITYCVWPRIGYIDPAHVPTKRTRILKNPLRGPRFDFGLVGSWQDPLHDAQSSAVCHLSSDPSYTKQQFGIHLMRVPARRADTATYAFSWHRFPMQALQQYFTARMLDIPPGALNMRLQHIGVPMPHRFTKI